MNNFIIFSDYEKHIQKDALMQVVGQKLNILKEAQASAIEECASYLRQKYNVATALKDVVKHASINIYKAGDVVYLDAEPYLTSATYAIGDIVVSNEVVYKCNTAISTSEPFNASKWDRIGEQNEIFTAILPCDQFDYKVAYKKGNEVYWKGKVYTALRDSMLLDHQALLNVNQAGSSVVSNIFPDDTAQGKLYWGDGVGYEVPANTSILDTTYWANVDGRDQKLLEVCINITLYKIHARIAPKNVPDIRIINYMGDPNDRETRGQRILYPTYCALGWLQAAAIGDDITPSMEKIQPDSGKRIRYGGNQKNINSY